LKNKIYETVQKVDYREARLKDYRRNEFVFLIKMHIPLKTEDLGYEGLVWVTNYDDPRVITLDGLHQDYKVTQPLENMYTYMHIL
jgi:hypothetical protein